MYKELLSRFTQHLTILNRSPGTIKSYLLYADRFLQSTDAKDVKQITTTMIEKYIAGLYDYKSDENKPYSIGTISLKIRSVKRLFEFLEQANIIFIDPAASIKEPKKQPCKIKPTLTPKQVRKILDQPNLGTLIGIRDRTILEVFYSTGIRLGELCHLTIYDADLMGGVLRINKGKGNKDRIVPMGRHAIKFLREYISKVRPKFTKKNRTSRHLFVNKQGNPLSRQVISIMIRTCRKQAKIKQQVTAHTFRHTFATILVKNNADITAVQKMMGHCDLKTTQGYIRSLGMDIKKEHKKTHPREKDKENIKTYKPRLQRLKGHYAR